MNPYGDPDLANRMHRENLEALARIEKKIDGCKEILEGPPGEPEQGLVFKHQWLSASVAKVAKLFWAAIIGAATAVGAAIVALTGGRHQ